MINMIQNAKDQVLSLTITAYEKANKKEDFKPYHQRKN